MKPKSLKEMKYSKSINDKGLIFYDDKAFEQHLITEHKCDICNKDCNDFYSFKINEDIYNGHKECYLNLINKKGGVKL